MLNVTNEIEIRKESERDVRATKAGNIIVSQIAPLVTTSMTPRVNTNNDALTTAIATTRTVTATKLIHSVTKTINIANAPAPILVGQTTPTARTIGITKDDNNEGGSRCALLGYN